MTLSNNKLLFSGTYGFLSLSQMLFGEQFGLGRSEPGRQFLHHFPICLLKQAFVARIMFCWSKLYYYGRSETMSRCHFALEAPWKI